MKNTELDILRLVYSDIETICDGVYAVKNDEEYGVVINGEVKTSPINRTIPIFRDKYTIFDNNETIKIIAYNGSMLEYPLLKKIAHKDTVKEHSALEYRLLEINDGERVHLIDTLNNTEITQFTGDNATTSYRPGDYIVYAIEIAGKNDIMGISADEFKYDTVSALLSKIYSSVTTSKGKNRQYNCINKDGDIDVRNKFGQLY